MRSPTTRTVVAEQLLPDAGVAQPWQGPRPLTAVDGDGLFVECANVECTSGPELATLLSAVRAAHDGGQRFVLSSACCDVQQRADRAWLANFQIIFTAIRDAGLWRTTGIAAWALRQAW